MIDRIKPLALLALVGLGVLCLFHPSAYSQDKIMGQIQFVGSSKAAKTSGVWVDGEYVGYLGELKGSNRLRLLPGDHEITVRQAGYVEYSRRLVIEPRTVLEVHVQMAKDQRFRLPDPKTSSEVRLNIQPGRAAVFLDDTFVGNVDEFYGIGHAMLVTPGKHRFKIALPGYKTFETELSLLPRQKFELKTDLIAGSINDADPIIRAETPAATSFADETSPTR